MNPTPRGWPALPQTSSVSPPPPEEDPDQELPPLSGSMAAFIVDLRVARGERPRYHVSSRVSARRWRASRASDGDAVDPRGFVVPQPGEVVVFPGKWPGEDAVGLVDKVQFVQERSSHIADVIPLRSVAPSLYAVERRGRATRFWMDVGRLRVARDAEFVKAQNAYRLGNLSDGYAKIEADPDAQERYLAEYKQLKQELLRSAAISGATGVLLSFVVTQSTNVSTCFALGSFFGIVYLILLQRDVDSTGPGSAALFSKLRFLLPVAPLIMIALSNSFFKDAIVRDSDGFLPVTLRGDVVLATMLGFLSYKVPILIRSAQEVVDSLDDVELEGTSLGGTLVAAVVKLIRGERADEGQEEGEISLGVPRRPIVICGPSGVGKSTLIAMLLAHFPAQFGFSVSHTTRDPRPGEVNGESYHFVSVADFRSMLDRGDFIEWAEVHGNYYGTSFSSVDRVMASGRNCILDVDVQGVESLRASPRLDPVFIWIAPPSVEELTRRLSQRGTESALSLRTRTEQAFREIEYAATSGVFDLTIINDDLERAGDELTTFLKPWLSPSR